MGNLLNVPGTSPNKDLVLHYLTISKSSSEIRSQLLKCVIVTPNTSVLIQFGSDEEQLLSFIILILNFRGEAKYQDKHNLLFIHSYHHFDSWVTRCISVLINLTNIITKLISFLRLA